MEANKRIGNNIRKVRLSEKSFEETRNLSPIEEESESTLYFKEPPSNITVNDPEKSGYKMIRIPCKEYHRISKNMEGDSSSGDERMEQNYHRLRRVKGSYCCLKPGVLIKEAEASGDNDEAKTGLRDKSLKTTVEQLKRRLSQAEREIVALKRQRSPQKCQSHERCKILQQDLLTWRDDHEKRISAQIVRWQLAERGRIRDEMENTRKVYDNIQRHLQTLERRSTESYFDFRRHIDVWEKRLKDDVVTLHENNLRELREQLRAWLEIQNAISSSNSKEKCEVHKLSNDTPAGEPNHSFKSTKSEVMSYENNIKFLRAIERIVKFEVQQQCDGLIRRLDEKMSELWSAFENFKHNFHLDRNYRRHNYVEINTDTAESSTAEDSSNSTCQESTKSDLNTDFEEKCAS